MSNLTTSESGKITKEVRFAVVMYGGVSLAIYMNGIAQELLSMVRSTSGDEKMQKSLKGTAIVYHDIAEYLSKNRHSGAFGYRFIVDIVAGTSAGGINGICLAKALVRGLEDLNDLQKTWLEEGDIDKLLNDHHSDLETYRSQDPKTSLFNSQRMYGKLLDAFKNMESKADENKSHIESMDLYVTATDLRGINRPIVLENCGGEKQVNEEKIFKHVFPFSYRADEATLYRKLNHFTSEFDTVLAFAARCTSSIPPAFEPVTVSDIKSYLAQRSPEDLKLWNTTSRDRFTYWRQLFFSAYADTDSDHQLLHREFADGGYLDNRPFGHAIDAIHAREADCPISRKLVFIDPKPEQAEKRHNHEQIDFVKNLSLATVSLPRYETIRGELDGLRQRNEWLSTVDEIIKKLESQNDVQLKKIVARHFQYCRHDLGESPAEEEMLPVNLFFPFRPADPQNPDATEVLAPQGEVKRFWDAIALQSMPSKQRLANAAHDSRSLDTMVDELGSGYTTYHYARVDALSKEISKIALRAMNAENQDDIVRTVNRIVELWRNDRYESNPPSEANQEALAPRELENRYLRNYDLDFRIRRLSRFRKQIEKALRDNSTKRLYFGLFVKPKCSGTEEKIMQCRNNWDAGFTMTDEFREAIIHFYHKLTETSQSLYRLRNLLFSRGDQNPLHKEAEQLKVFIDEFLKTRKPFELALFSDERNATACKHASPEATPQQKAAFEKCIQAFMDALHKRVRITSSEGLGEEALSYEGTVDSSTRIDMALRDLGKRFPEIAGCLQYMYDYGYDLHDMTTFPLLAGGDYGEGSIVDIARISPIDATSLWNENERKLSKLAGVALGSFGAFLDDEWRRNDIMWGRLDAAEKLINVLFQAKDEDKVYPEGISVEERRALEDSEVDAKKRFIRRAQFAIINESTQTWINELKPKSFNIQDIRSQVQFNRIQSIRKTLDTQLSSDPGNQGLVVMPEWINVFKTEYDFNRKPDTPPNLQRMGRGSAILSSMVNGLDDADFIGKPVGGYLKKLSWVILGMLDFLTPKTFPNILLGYWLRLFLLFAIFLILTGIGLRGVNLFQDAGNIFFWTGWVLFSLDIIVQLSKEKFTGIIHEAQKSSTIHHIVFGVITGGLSAGMFYYLWQIITNAPK